jgi:tetratricopeptide (TPR) repeat protein
MSSVHANIAAKAIVAVVQPKGLPQIRCASSARIFLFSILTVATLFAVPVYAQSGTRLREARDLLTQHDEAGAETTIRSYLHENPDSADAHFLLAYTLFREKKATDSLAEYTAAARYRKPSADDLMAIGADYVLLNDNEDADRLFMQVTAIQPNNELAWYYLGRARFYENRFEDAVKVFDMCLRLKPHDVSAETNLGLAYQELGRDNDAIAAYRQAIDWDKQAAGRDGQPYLDMGLVLRTEQRVDESLNYLETAAEFEPNNPETHFELAKTYEALRKYKEAEAQLRIVLAIAPNASAVHYILGRILKTEGRASEAEQEFAVTSKLNGTHSTKEVTNFNFSDSPSIDAGAAASPTPK